MRKGKNEGPKGGLVLGVCMHEWKLKRKQKTSLSETVEFWWKKAASPLTTTQRPGYFSVLASGKTEGGRGKEGKLLHTVLIPRGWLCASVSSWLFTSVVVGVCVCGTQSSSSTCNTHSLAQHSARDTLRGRLKARPRGRPAHGPRIGGARTRIHAHNVRTDESEREREREETTLLG